MKYYIINYDGRFLITTECPNPFATCDHLDNAKAICDALNALKTPGNHGKTEANWYQQGYDAREKELPGEDRIIKILKNSLGENDYSNAAKAIHSQLIEAKK